MVRAGVLLAGVIVLVAAWSAGSRLEERAREAASAAVPPARLMERLAPGERGIGAIRLYDSGGAELIYSNRIDGVWRCLTTTGAVVDLRIMNRLFDKMLTAPVRIRSDRPADPGAYGVGLDQTPVIALYPRAGDGERAEDLPALLEIEIGHALADEDQTFLRVVGETAVLVLEADLDAELRTPAPGIPPLVDPHLVPASWPGAGGAPRQVQVRPRTGPAFDLLRIDAGDEGDPTESGSRWVVRHPDGREVPAMSIAAMAYSMYLLRTPIVAVVDPMRVGDHGLGGEGVSRLLVEGVGGAVLEVRIGEMQNWGLPAWTSFGRSLLALDPAMESVLFPDPALLTEEGRESPWLRLLNAARPPDLPWRFGPNVQGR